MEYVENINNIANYFLSIKSMSPKKLQKIIYYAYSWYIVNNNDSNAITNALFEEKPQAWVHGPVFPSLYEKYKVYGRDEITTKDSANIDEDMRNFLDEIWNVFGKYDGDTLELMTHNEVPWIMARKDLDSMEPSSNELDMSLIYNYYSSL